MSIIHDVFRRKKDCRGSALLLTLLVVSILLVIVLAMTVMVRMSLREQQQLQAMHQARANAKLGLELAMARLQEVAGPDQRVTARAEILDSLPATPETDGVAQPSWCVVYESPDRETDYDLDQGAGLRSTAAGPAWLVSGGDAAGFDASAFSPVVTGPGRNAARLRTQPILPDVEVPLIEVGSTGRYAFWVDDEGVKARINLLPDAASVDGEASDRYHSPATPGVEQALAVADRADFPINDSGTLAKFVSEGTMDFHTDSAWRSDGSLWSRGVLANVKQGGLKTDLTAAFEDPTQFEALAGREVPGFVSTAYADRQQDDVLAGKIWKAMSDSTSLDGRWYPFFWFYNVYKDRLPAIPPSVTVGTSPRGLGGIGGDTVEPRWSFMKENSMVHPVTIGSLLPVPVGFKAELALSTIFLNHGADGVVNTPDDEYGLRIHYIPSLVMWNPYDVTLTEPTVGGNPTSYILSASLFLDHNLDAMDLRVTGDGWTEDISVFPKTFIPDNNRFQSSDVFSFRIRDGEKQFGPGEIKVYGLDGDEALPATEQIPPLTETYADGFSAYWDLPLSNTLTRGQTMTVQFQERVIAANANYHVAAGNGWPGRVGSLYANGLNNPQNRFEGVGAQGGMGGSSAYVNVFSAIPPSLEGVANMQRVVAYMSRVKGRRPEDTGLRIPTQGGPGSRFNTAVLFNSMSFWAELHRTGTGFVGSEEFQTQTDNLAFWGEFDLGVSGSVTNQIAYELPRSPMRSLGQFKNLPADYPASMVTVGTSWPQPDLPLDQVFDLGEDADSRNNLADDVWLNNDAFFDGYFFSTVPPGSRAANTVYPDAWGNVAGDFTQDNVDAGEALLNPRLSYVRPSEAGSPLLSELRNLDQAAAHLMVEGAFNVNSTSVAAWRAVLVSLRFPDDPTAGAPVPRFVERLSTRPDSEDVEAGERVLTDTQVEALAQAVVTQVKTRGPFLSVSDFLNRRVENSELGRKGALQAAIEASGINNAARGTLGSESFLLPANWELGQKNSFSLSRQATLRTLAAADNYDTAMGAPGMITQADLVQYLAPVLAARSDTFIIRVCGESGPVETPNSRVWMEVVVQRIPGYVDEGDPAWERGGDLSAVNARFGRRYRILSAKWLSENEI